MIVRPHNLDWLAVNAEGGGAGTVAVDNGDVNGGSGRDLTDAVYSLNWLFRGRPQSVALAETTDLAARVEALERGRRLRGQRRGESRSPTPPVRPFS